MRPIGCLLSLLLLAGASTAAPQGPMARVVLSEADFRDRVYACWLGKNIGGTLGAPFEGQRQMRSLTFYEPVPREPSANDDLDLQILWLKVLEERGTRITARDLGQYWLKYVPVDWNEYGIGKANLRLGFPPPLSGQFRNKWRDSNGAWIRSEIWACLAPGQPALAAQFAWEDACVDHGAAEGTYAELFTASLESAAFVEKDRERLLDIGLSYLPADCAVAKSIRAARDAHRRGLDLKAAREAVVQASRSTGWFMAPQNVAFTVLGWLYGEGDFGKSICAAVNCGDDTDCTGATLGALWGILYGTDGIPEAWRTPVGATIRNVAIAGFPAPRTLDELTDRTVAMAHRVLSDHRAPVEIRAGAATKLPARTETLLVDRAAARRLWSRSPYRYTETWGDLSATLDLASEPEVIGGEPRAVTLLLTNLTGRPRQVRYRCRVDPALAGAPAETSLRLPARGSRTVTFSLTAPEGFGGVARGSVSVLSDGGAVLGELPFALAGKAAVHKGNLASGATAASDSELDREPGCTAKVVDGIIPTEESFEGQRWHSALTEHPHWVALTLPRPRKVGRAVLHFADPAGYPVDFECQGSRDGQTWQTLCAERGSTEPRRYDHRFQPMELRHFRVLIRRSASRQWPNAAQLGEIELLP